MKIKLSATFEGKCDICGREAVVFTAGDEDTKMTVTVCDDCSKRLGDKKTSDVIQEYGHLDEESFKEGVHVEKKKVAG